MGGGGSGSMNYFYVLGVGGAKKFDIHCQSRLERVAEIIDNRLILIKLTDVTNIEL